MLYLLWDLGLKVGHSSRSIDEMVRMAKGDLTIRTALLEGRYLWGDQALYEEASAPLLGRGRRRDRARSSSPRSSPSATSGTSGMGDSRYVVEPNVKEGKGGLRDLQTLFWIGKYIHKVRAQRRTGRRRACSPAPNTARFRRAEGFLLAVRCHLHTITKRAEDRLTFDLQREVARRMQFADRPGKSAVERFMQFYFLQAKRVGDLTGHLPRPARRPVRSARPPRGLLAGFRAKPRHAQGLPRARRADRRAGRRLVPRRSGAAGRDLPDRRGGRARDPPRDDAHGRARRGADPRRGPQRSARQCAVPRRC